MQTISIWQCKPGAVFDEIRPYRSLSEWFGITLLAIILRLSSNSYGWFDLVVAHSEFMKPTRRVSAALLFSLAVASLFLFLPSSFGVSILICAVPVFVIGVAEDLTNRISAFVRLLVSIFSAGLLTVGLNVVITDTGFEMFDSFLQIQVLAMTSICAITAHCHAVNIADG